MLVKRQHQRNAVVLPRVCDRLAQDLLMPQMYAVKKPDRQANLFAFRIEFVRSVNDIHRNFRQSGAAAN
jgi:hypothetical protein